ncbi:winged helix-turn-helix domain-containing protein [Aeromonas sp. 30P]|uniref:winged helix-turn-helix domain-containing protein n=1 Tax=Aeromonas sp. 30P TaxID=3452717 RepID=UPI0038D304C7
MLLLDSNSGDVFFNESLIARIGLSETLIMASFINRRSSLILKDELLDIGWPDKFVAPNSLAVAIKNIRKMLLITACDELFIETVHRKGYIFHCGEVQCGFIDNQRNKVDETKLDLGISFYDSKHSANQQRFKKKWPLLLSTNQIKNMFYCLSFMFFLFISILIYSSKINEVCYNIKNARLCGIFILDEKTRTMLSDRVGEQRGSFIYGYEKNLVDIGLYKMD